ncbi:MAG: hypothetical protein RBS28_13350, partial [Rhodocyclaceae bacterium]|nr:hypothetical protein [Rhodocyclaceae bacterium]
LLLSSWLCCLPAAAQACRCMPLTLAEYFERAEVVFEAEVLAVAVVPADARDAAHRRATIRVHGDYGNAAGIVAVRTAIDTAQCGLDLRPGARYWIFGHLRPAEFEVWTGHCDGSRLVTEDFRDVPAKDVAARLTSLAGNLDCPSPAPAEIARRIRLDVIDRLPTPDAVVSPNGAYRYRLQTPPPIARPPRVSTLIVDTEGPQYLRLSLHGAQSTSAAWINEKLIHLRVAWGGRLRTNLVLDVEHERIVTAHHEHRADEGEEWKPLADGCRRKNGPATNE